MRLFNWLRKDKFNREPDHEIELVESGPSYKEETRPFGQHIVTGEFRRFRYKGNSEEIKNMIASGFQPRNNRLIDRSEEPRYLRSASDDDELPM
ncbi:MAG: hypothetical protein RMY30_036710 [Nostoc sp. CmiSLP01]|nr:hypothetical protein [Nostoc sp. CmiSLP01]MDZ8286323.1 hypothetical protein [Nostoc sp. ChiSLP01]